MGRGSGSCGAFVRLLLGAATGWTTPATVAAAVLVASTALGAAVLLRLRARRLAWQPRAGEGPPEGPCRGGRYCQRRLTPKPSRRTIVRLEVEATTEAGERLERCVDDEPVAALNDAVSRYRHERGITPEGKSALFQTAKTLADSVDEWLGGAPAARRDVAFRARLEGKADCVYTLWRCSRGRWRRGRSWKVEVDDVRHHPVAMSSHPYPVAVVAEVLLAQLTSFVAEVDVAATTAAPDRAPVLHG